VSNLPNHPNIPEPRKTDELFEELDTTLCRALVLSDELRRRFGCCPDTKAPGENPDQSDS
jgi:hypothetical protein